MSAAGEPSEPLSLNLRDDTSPMAQAAQPRQLLLATADAALGTRLRRLLDLIGHRVDACATGREALSRWRAGGVELLLLDDALPDLEGRALARRVRADEAIGPLPRTPIVAVHRAAPGCGNAPDADIDDVLEQPLHITALQSLLRRWLPPLQTAPPPCAHAPRGDAEQAAPEVELAVLHRLVGDEPAVVRATLLDYLKSAQQQAILLRRAYRRGDMRQVGALAHKLKSASLAVGALALGERCGAMELPTQTGFDAVQSEHARFNRVFEATIGAVQAHLRRLPR